MNGVGGAAVADRAQLTESALDSLIQGVALADTDARIAFWNDAAEIITGFSGFETVGRGVREILDVLIVGGARQWIWHTDSDTAAEHGSVVHILHKAGHQLPVLARLLVLRDAFGERIGTAVFFHPVESIDALPHGRVNEDAGLGESPSEMEARLAALHQDFLDSNSPLGLLWVAIDQSRELRRTHGGRACQAMLEKLERTLTAGLKPAEEILRWGDDEFLVLSHERSETMLAARARTLTGLARTTEFRWWGDRVSLTVSIGAAQANRGETLTAFLERAQAAMLASVRAGGNQATTIPERNSCSPS
jgi:diguanylate cyclase (GGDEF)-like protein/PAS domain S-box-containing protein